MAIIVYTGVMGSGKTYEAVRTAALGALKAGRRVVTNISGFNFEAIRDHLGEFPDGSLLEADKVVVIPSRRITEPHFFFDPSSTEESVVKPGDLVLIDEVWEFWGTDAKLPPEHQKFFRMHRHYTEVDSGISCDLLIMIQDLMSLHRFIKGVVESNLKFTKMKTLGLSSRYRVDVFEGNKQRKANLVSSSVNKYDKRIFPLYKSYDAGAGKEGVVDGRQNLLANKWFLGSMAVAVLGLLWAGWWFVGYVAHLRSGGVTHKPASEQGSPANGQAAAPGAPPTNSTPAVASDTRLIGVIAPSAGETTVILQLADGRILRQRMNAGLVDGWQSVAGYQGHMAGFYFGGATGGKAK